MRTAEFSLENAGFNQMHAIKGRAGERVLADCS
jgi:hypothetical protein